MSHEIPVFTCSISCDAALGAELTLDDALRLISEDNLMSSMSRNWWYQGLVAELLEVYKGFEELRYINKVVAVIEIERLLPTADAIERLMQTIKVDTEPFVRITTWYGASVEEVRQYITQAIVSPHLNDDSNYAFGNFFSFLASQAAALVEAKKSGRCILYVQPQP